MRLLVETLSILFLFTSSLRAQDAELIRLPKYVTSEFWAYQEGKPRPIGTETNMAGWLVLNGARFSNTEYPELARVMREHYAALGMSDADPDTTKLFALEYTTDSHGRIVRGHAICPSSEICGGLVGAMVPFNLDSSL